MVGARFSNAGSSCEHFVPTDAVVWTESRPGSEVRLGFPSAHVQSHFTDDRLRNDHVDAIDARQIHTGDALQFIGEVEVRIILVLFLLLFRGKCLFHWRRDRFGKSAQVLLQFQVAFGHPSLVGVIHFHFLLQHEDEFLAPIALQAFGNLCTAGLNPRMTEFRKLCGSRSPAMMARTIICPVTPLRSLITFAS